MRILTAKCEDSSTELSLLARVTLSYTGLATCCCAAIVQEFDIRVYLVYVKHMSVVNAEIFVEARVQASLVVYDSVLQHVLVFLHPSVTARPK